MDVPSYKARQNKQRKYQGTNSEGKEVEVVWACRVKKLQERSTIIYRKEGDEHENTREKKQRNA